jgi:hypothetical protein
MLAEINYFNLMLAEINYINLMLSDINYINLMCTSGATLSTADYGFSGLVL